MGDCPRKVAGLGEEPRAAWKSSGIKSNCGCRQEATCGLRQGWKQPESGAADECCKRVLASRMIVATTTIHEEVMARFALWNLYMIVV